ncbi:Os04g0286400 [Oryza sativa Japonica Group]|uniref:Os04g0286400 protein n=3 Tax=Oryza sativa TaxID=4530 RepID=A0A0P0W8L9_ORYSJ|nr:hypothetical protein OsI_15230 [Oryza sativa Indica Group]EEE60678.1 hypothetical protein OsJ_14142 [Oryza sativa Japonica Group]KAB8095128.1 hypothetical protein EE612_022832 [Oryza sativa]BAF14291.1 Os04g0286400 [Oryza sativa Japonica Group]BAS88398.1 Os04g0286400 [Oryza sativa Japonica Group]|eukprot:NP_001052377.1 Os04g0286400 [Oryza sativa Japonica Group]
MSRYGASSPPLSLISGCVRWCSPGRDPSLSRLGVVDGSVRRPRGTGWSTHGLARPRGRLRSSSPSPPSCPVVASSCELCSLTQQLFGV